MTLKVILAAVLLPVLFSPMRAETTDLTAPSPGAQVARKANSSTWTTRQQAHEQKSPSAAASADTAESGAPTPVEVDGAEKAVRGGSVSAESWWKRNNVFDHLEVALNVGSTGLGLELASPITDWARLRAGFDYIPRFSFDAKFDVASYDSQLEGDTFERVRDMMYQISGYDMDRTVAMKCTPTIQNWKVLLDLYPIPGDRRWRITGGLFGGSSVIGKTINRMEEMPTLLTIGMFNNIHDMAVADDFVEKMFDEKFLGLVYLDMDAAQALHDKMEQYGRLGIYVGDRPGGTPYYMEPDSKGTISAKARVNRVKPYVGVGFDGPISRDGRLTAGFDLGAMFWGGAPKVVTHDGTVLNDFKHLRGDVRSYMNTLKAFPVWPVASFRLAWTIL